MNNAANTTTVTDITKLVLARAVNHPELWGQMVVAEARARLAEARARAGRASIAEAKAARERATDAAGCVLSAEAKTLGMCT